MDEKMATSIRLAQLEAAWKDTLAGTPVFQNLPFDRPRSAVATAVGHLDIAIPNDLVLGIRALARRYDATPFAVLETVLAVLCGQLSRSRDVVIGCLVGDSQALDTEATTEPFVIPVPLRHAIRANISFLEHLRQGADAIKWATEHGELPFSEILDATGRSREISYHPLFQILCEQKVNAAETSAAADHIDVNSIPHNDKYRIADLAVTFPRDSEPLSAHFAYSAELFDHSTVEAVAALYVHIISMAVNDPEKTVESIWKISIAYLASSIHRNVIDSLIANPYEDTGSWYELSSAQQSLWLQELAAPSGTSYHAMAVMRCTASLDRACLEAAIQGLIVQSQIFWLDWSDAGLQRQSTSPTTEIVHLSTTAEMTCNQWRGAIEEWNSTRNDLSSGIALFNDDGGTGIAMRSHHLVGDGWAVTRCFDRIARNYALLEKNPSHVFEMDRFFLDTLRGDKIYLSSDQHTRDGDFWKSVCRTLGGPPLIDALADHPQATDQPRLVHSVRRTLSSALHDTVIRVAGELLLSPAEYVTALTMLYLTQFHGESPPALGVAFLNRVKDALDIPGQFATALPLAASLDVTDTIASATRAIAEAFQEALKHGRYPFGEMVRHHGLNPRHTEVSVNTLFLKRGIEIGGETTHIQWLTGPESGLSFLFTQFGRYAPLDLELRFNSALFDEVTIERHADRLLQFIEIASGGTGVRVCDVPMLLDDERHLLLDTWNATEQPYPSDRCIHQLFEDQVARSPQAIAVVFGDEQLSYAELNARANRVAHRLIAEGVRPDDRVALCMERSTGLVVALLGILKSGGAYVPLDPAYPGERLRHVLSDASPSCVLLDAIGRHAIGKDVLGDHPTIDAIDASGDGDRAVDNPDTGRLGLRPDHLAYVIYTSGSTGVPKGVMVEHRHVSHLAQAQIDLFQFSVHSRIAQFSSISFDASMWEIVMALCAGEGASLHIVPDAERYNASWPEFLSERAITHVTLPPAVLASYGNLPPLSNLRTLVLAGESPGPALGFAQGTGAEVVNAYGLTEATVCATAWSCPEKFNGIATPIGRPVANTSIYLLDTRQQPVPLGAAGELYIGGAGVARGYWNRPELTAERFLPDPFHGGADARMYRTGDLARYLPDGNLVYLGRNDDQVKIRGFRIEPGEIEARLTEHPDVREAAVIARDDDAGGKRLIAYVVISTDETGTLYEDETGPLNDSLIPTLRAFLSTRLPDYMVPAAFVCLGNLPLTPNGKLDRQALPAPDDEAFVRETYEAPQGETEMALATLWQELLGVARVGRHDNFFALGGHSLLAARMLSRARTRLGRSLSLRTLYESLSIAELAVRMNESHKRVDALQVLVPLRTNGNLPPLFCVHSSISIGWSYANLLPYLPDRPLYALQSRALTDPNHDLDTIEAMAVDYLQKIREIRPTGPYHLLGWSLGCSLVHAIATLMQEQGAQVELLVLLDGYPGSAPPDVRASLPSPPLEDIIEKYVEQIDTEMREYLDEDLIRSLVKQSNAYLPLLANFKPKLFDGDVLFFSASQIGDQARSLPHTWRPFVTGAIESHEIDCSHVEMMQKDALLQIGPILTDVLAQRIGGN